MPSEWKGSRMPPTMASTLVLCRSHASCSQQQLGEHVFGDGFPVATGITHANQVVGEIVHIEAHDAWLFAGDAWRVFWRRMFRTLERLHCDPSDLQMLRIQVV